MKLKPINIAVVAPTGAGKTALISTVCDYIKSKSNKAKGYTLKIENKAATELNDFARNLSGQLAAKNMNFNSGLIKGTTECTEYEFAIVFNDNKTNIEVVQPFKILDIPGAFVNNKTKFEDDSEYEKFISHLDQSRILWVPIDAAVLMEASSDNEKGCSQKVREVKSLSEFVIEWAQYAAKNNQLDYCDFVLVKSETYFSQDRDNRYNNCKNRFDESYGSLVKKIKEENSQDKIACVAVETIGSVKVNSSKWIITEEVCQVEYQVTSTERVISGADCLLNDALKVAKENVQSEIFKLQAEKEAEIDKLGEKKNSLINQQQNKIKELKSRKEQLVKHCSDLQSKEVEFGKTTIFDIIGNIFTGNLDKLKETIKTERVIIQSTGQQITDAENELSKIEKNVSYTSQELKNAEHLIEGYNSLIGHLNNLGIQNTQTEYYRSL